MPYVRPLGPGETASLAHQPLALPRTKHRRRAESSASASEQGEPGAQGQVDEGRDIAGRDRAISTSDRGVLFDLGAAVKPPAGADAHQHTEDVPTPRPRAGSASPLVPSRDPSVVSPSSHVPPRNIPCTSVIDDDDDTLALSSTLASTSLDSQRSQSQFSQTPSLSSSRQSPAGTSIASLSEQGGDSSSSSRRNSRPYTDDGAVFVTDDEEGEGEERKTSGRGQEEEEEFPPPTTTSGTPDNITSNLRLELEHGDPMLEAIVTYRRGLLAYTKTLYIQAQLSNSRAEKRRQSTSSQFGLKQSGMEKMAAKKALTKRLNG